MSESCVAARNFHMAAVFVFCFITQLSRAHLFSNSLSLSHIPSLLPSFTLFQPPVFTFPRSLISNHELIINFHTNFQRTDSPSHGIFSLTISFLFFFLFVFVFHFIDGFFFSSFFISFIFLFLNLTNHKIKINACNRWYAIWKKRGLEGLWMRISSRSLLLGSSLPLESTSVFHLDSPLVSLLFLSNERCLSLYLSFLFSLWFLLYVSLIIFNF